jgi:hypothetical protein
MVDTGSDLLTVPSLINRINETVTYVPKGRTSRPKC